MSKNQINELRRALGLSESDMAAALGLTGSNAADHLREMERGTKSVTGPMSIVLGYMMQAVEFEGATESDMLMDVLPRFLDCSNLEEEEDVDGVEIIMHTRWPRFYGLVLDADFSPTYLQIFEEIGLSIVKMDDEAGLGWMVVIFIDQPITSATAVIQEAVRLKTDQAWRDLR